MAYFFPFFAAGLADFFAAGFLAAAFFGADSFFAAGAGAMVSTCGASTGARCGSSECARRAAASFERTRRSCRRTSRLQRAGRGELHAIQIAASQLEIAVFAVVDNQGGAIGGELVQGGVQSFGLVRFERPGVHHGKFLVRQLRRKSGAQRSEEHLFGQRVAIVARLGSVDRAAMTPQRRTNRTDARAAGALLPPELAARAADFALILGLVRARAEAGEIPARSFVQQILVNLRAENGIRQLERADFLATQIYHIHHRHNFCPWSSNYFAFLPA